MRADQLELFDENDEVTFLRKEVKRLRYQIEKSRRALCSHHNHLAKLCMTLQEENEELKRRLDKLEKMAQLNGEKTSDDLLEKLFREAYMPNLKE
jgi:hypothetical protein